MSYIESINIRKNYIERMLSSLYKELDKLPAGRLKCYRYDGYDKWYNTLVSAGEERQYIRRGEKRFAESLAARGYYETMIADLKAELNGIEGFLRKYDRIKFPAGSRYYGRGPAYRDLLKPIFDAKDAKVRAFLSQEFTGGSHQENRIYKCKNGLLVRSKSENEIADSLYSARLPFLYEYPLEVIENGRSITLNPDFNILDCYNDEIIIWEHCGIMDDVHYARIAGGKLPLFASAGFFPDENLILTFESKKHKLSSAEIQEKIDRFFPYADLII